MKRLHLWWCCLVIVTVVTGICSSCSAGYGGESSEILISDDFRSVSSEWEELYLEGTEGGSYTAEGGKLTIEMEGEGFYGLYYSKPVRGHFCVDAEFLVDRNLGLALLQEKNGEADIENYTMICVDKNEEGQVMVFINDSQNGKKNVLDNTGQLLEILREIEEERNEEEEEDDDEGEIRIPFQSDGYKHTLTGNKYSVPFKKTDKNIRIFRDDLADFFHFYYGVETEIRGESAEGWMELAPSKDWAEEGESYYVALVASGKGKAVFDKVKVQRKPKSDKKNREGFSVAQREYTWSGFFGDAVVVTFGDEFGCKEKEGKFVFWSATNYIPAWHMNNQLLYTYEFVETWGGGNPGCHEPMSDRVLRWSRVGIVEDNDVRKVVHWHYVLCNPDYKVPDDDEGKQLPEVDEYFTFYPDGSGTRYIVYTPKLDTDFRAAHELGEMISIAGCLTHSKPFYESPALTLTNLQGDVEHAHPGIKIHYGSHIDDWEQVIQVVHLKEEPDVFCVFSTDPQVPETYAGYPICYEIAWQSVNGRHSHWPVNLRPYTGASGSGGTWEAEVSHSCLISWGVHDRESTEWDDNYKVNTEGRKYRDWVSLIGLVDDGDLKEVRERCRSWLFPGEVKMIDESCRFVENDVKGKALVFESENGKNQCHFAVEPGEEGSVLVNPAFIIKNWRAGSSVIIEVNGDDLGRENYISDTEGNSLLLWVKKMVRGKTEFLIKGANETRLE